jgi:transcriptional regulator with XRE-family HTH domain
MSLSDIIRKARLVHGMSQRDLATRLGVHHSAVGAWEIGVNHPAVAHKIALSQALGIKFADLLPEVGDGVVLVTDRTLVALVRLVERQPAERRVGALRAVALWLELENTPPQRRRAAGRPSRKQRADTAG